MQSWHLRKARFLVYIAIPLCIVGIAVSCWMDGGNWIAFWVGTRQLFGLWALGFLLVAMTIGPLSSVLPWFPLKAHLVVARRAIGISAFAFAVAHMLAYLVPVLLRNWRELYNPGLLWIIGLVIGLAAFVNMGALTYTSRDKAVVKLGGKKWKRLHQTTYILLPVVIVHALFVGADFGVNRGPDVKSEPDSGALIGFLAVAALWLVLFILRKFAIKWNFKKRGNA